MNNEQLKTAADALELDRLHLAGSREIAMDAVLAFSRNEISQKDLNAKIKALSAEAKELTAMAKTMREAIKNSA